MGHYQGFFGAWESFQHFVTKPKKKQWLSQLQSSHRKVDQHDFVSTEEVLRSGGRKVRNAKEFQETWLIIKFLVDLKDFSMFLVFVHINLNRTLEVVLITINHYVTWPNSKTVYLLWEKLTSNRKLSFLSVVWHFSYILLGINLKLVPTSGSLPTYRRLEFSGLWRRRMFFNWIKFIGKNVKVLYVIALSFAIIIWI